MKRVVIMSDCEYKGLIGYVVSESDNEDGTKHYRIIIDGDTVYEGDNLFLHFIDKEE